VLKALLLALLTCAVACDRPPAPARSGSDLAAGLAAHPESARVVVGGPESPEVAELLARLAPGVTVEGSAWSILGHKYSLGGCLLVAVFEDPRTPGIPLTLVVSGDPARLARAERELRPGWRPSLELWRLGERVFSARLSVRGELRPDSAVLAEDRSHHTLAKLDGAGLGQVEVLFDPGQVSAARVSSYLAEVGQSLAAASWADLPEREPARVVVVTELSAQQALEWYDPSTNTLTAALGSAVNDGGRALLEARFIETLGPPAEPWMADAAAMAAVGRIAGRDLETWVSWLARDRSWNASELSDGQRSPWATRALRASMWRRLVTQGRAREIWEGGPFDQDGQLSALLAEKSALGRMPTPIPVRRGLIDGDVDLALQAGADAILIRAHVPIHGRWGDGGPWRGASGPTTLEGDGALLIQVARARAAGLRVILACYLLSSPSGTYDGDRVMTSAGQWREHFRQRTRAIVHVGLLGELAGAEVLLVGAGTPHAANTVSVADEPRPMAEARAARVEGWNALLDGARSAFGGVLAFQSEFPRWSSTVGFWDRVDLMVLDLPEPRVGNSRALVRRFEQVLGQARDFAQAEAKPWLAVAQGYELLKLGALLQAADGMDAGMLISTSECEPASLGTLLRR
jgi:hypothetical protein